MLLGFSVGFSTGTFAQYLDTREALKVIKQAGCLAVELGVVRKECIEWGWLDALTAKDLDGFAYMSLHAPVMKYKNNEAVKKIFAIIGKINALRPLDAVVIHPCDVEDITVFGNLSFPVAFENMDNTKPYGKTPEDVKKLIDSDPSFRFVLDVNHIKTNDPTMKLADQFYAALGNKLTHYHVSGLGTEKPHVPLFEMHQKEIVAAIKNIDAPIICESGIHPNNIKKEKEFIEKYLERN